ncbi:MAG: tetratricopeptide repeat protein [Spirochaetales bacterium]|nr:tetratricopeptide repeat protein [Spirochaetales bacterium]
MEKKPDPLAGVVFLKIPEELASRLSGALPPSLLIPCERPAGLEGPPAVTIEAVIAGMLRVLIYAPTHPDAAAYAEIVRELRPGIKEEFTQAGRIKAGSKDFPIAVEIFRALAALFPGDPVCAFNIALVYHDAALHLKGDRSRAQEAAEYADLAFEAYRSALALDNVLPDTVLNYGFFLLEQENYEKALRHFEEYLRRETDERKKAPVRKIFSNLATYQKQDALFKEAFDDITMGKEEDGIRKTRAILENHPDFWNGWFLLGWGLRRLSRYAEAKDAFLKVLSLASPKTDVLNELAIVHMELGELEESYRRLTAAAELEPENVKVLSNLGVVSDKLNRPQEAVGFFRTVIELNPGDPVALGYLEKLAKK